MSLRGEIESDIFTLHEIRDRLHTMNSTLYSVEIENAINKWVEALHEEYARVINRTGVM